MDNLLDLWRLRIDHYLIIDNFFPDNVCKHLRNLSMELTSRQTLYDMEHRDYKSVDFDSMGTFNSWTGLSLKEIVDKYVNPKIRVRGKSSYQRGWSFVYNNVARGVLVHTDPSFLNINLWVTPDESVEDHTKNGLIIYQKRYSHSSDIDYSPGEPSNDFVDSFLEDAKCAIIPYKYNRAVIFRGDTFHSTDHVHMKPGDENKRVSYTFLYY